LTSTMTRAQTVARRTPILTLATTMTQMVCVSMSSVRTQQTVCASPVEHQLLYAKSTHIIFQLHDHN
jgi:hypothetical protein